MLRLRPAPSRSPPPSPLRHSGGGGSGAGSVCLNLPRSPDTATVADPRHSRWDAHASAPDPFHITTTLISRRQRTASFQPAGHMPDRHRNSDGCPDPHPDISRRVNVATVMVRPSSSAAAPIVVIVQHREVGAVLRALAAGALTAFWALANCGAGTVLGAAAGSDARAAVTRRVLHTTETLLGRGTNEMIL